MLDASGRQLRARIAAYSSWAATSDVSARTAPARAGFLKRFEDQVDPERQLPPAERDRRATAARRAFYTKLAFKSSVARAGRKLRFTVKPEVAAEAA